MRVRHWLAEGIILSLLAFATFAQGAAGNGTKATANTSEDTTAAKTNTTSSRTPTPAEQAQQQEQKKTSNAPGSSDAAPAATPVQSAGADQTNSNNAEGAAASEGEITPGQTASTKPETLGEAARKAREERKAAGVKHAKVVTNDDVEEGPGVSVVGNSAAPGSEASASGSSKASLADQEKDWRARFANARAKLQRDQDELDVDQRQLGKLRVQYYNDPAKQLSQSITNEDVNKQQDKIDKDRQNIQKDQDNLSDLEDALRKSGGDPGWARP